MREIVMTDAYRNMRQKHPIPEGYTVTIYSEGNNPEVSISYANGKLSKIATYRENGSVEVEIKYKDGAFADVRHPL